MGRAAWRHVLLGAPARGLPRDGAARAGCQGRRGLRARRSFLRPRAGRAHDAPVVRHADARRDPHRGGRTRRRAAQAPQRRTGTGRTLMMKQRSFSQVDVFTAEPLRGNPLAVVHDAEGLSEERMQAFARWTNLSETSFLLPATD